MKGLDTNVLVRYIMQDDAKQARKATKIIESMDASNPGFVSNISLVELYWVLTSCYDLSNAQITQASLPVYFSNKAMGCSPNFLRHS